MGERCEACRAILAGAPPPRTRAPPQFFGARAEPVVGRSRSQRSRLGWRGYLPSVRSRRHEETTMPITGTDPAGPRVPGARNMDAGLLLIGIGAIMLLVS